MTDTTQVPKETVNYRYAEPTAAERCAACAHYLPGVRNMNSCTKVYGLVHGNYVCDLFTQRT